MMSYDLKEMFPESFKLLRPWHTKAPRLSCHRRLMCSTITEVQVLKGGKSQACMILVFSKNTHGLMRKQPQQLKICLGLCCTKELGWCIWEWIMMSYIYRVVLGCCYAGKGRRLGETLKKQLSLFCYSIIKKAAEEKAEVHFYSRATGSFYY